MKKINVLFAIALLLFPIQLHAQENAFQTAIRRGERPAFDMHLVAADAIEPGVLLVKLKDTHSKHMETQPIAPNKDGIVQFGLEEIDALCREFSVLGVTQHFSGIALKSGFSERHRAWGFHLWYRLEIHEKSDIISVVEAFQQAEEVAFAEPEYKKVPVWGSGRGSADLATEAQDAEKSWTPNDPLFDQQWHYHNTGQIWAGQMGADIDLKRAWDIEKGNPNVIVAIMDDGVDFNHPDLAANMWSGIGYNFVDNTDTIVPGHHGTHVAGTVAAVSNNNIGVAGIAGGTGSGDGVRLMSCQIFRELSHGQYIGGAFENAIVYAADQGAAISQNSWSYNWPLIYNQPDLDAIDYFNANGGGNAIINGGLTIFAAANSSSSAEFFPAAYAGAFAVASTDYNDKKSHFSNFGPWVDISAPGSSVLSTTINNDYTVDYGTSMACPHVSGVAALIASISNGLLSNMQVQDFIMQGADDITSANQGFDDLLGSGRLNAYNALTEAIRALNGVFPPLNFTAVSQSTDSIQLSWITPSGSDHVIIAYSDEPISWNPTNGIAYEQGFSIPSGGTIAYNGNGEVYHHIELEAGSYYYYKIWTFDETLAYSSARSAKAMTRFCQIEAKCEYTFRLISHPYFMPKDNWHVLQNGHIEAVLFKPNYDQFFDITVPLCGNAPFEVIWYPASSSDKAGIQIIGPYGNNIFEYLPQWPGPTEPILLFTGIADCDHPTCLMPVNIVIEEITDHQAVIDWQAQGAESLWNLEWGPRGFQTGSGNLIEGIENHPYVLTGLEAGAYYDFRLQADCGDGDLSFWSLPTTFTTSCGMFLLPLFEDFNDDPPGELPLCWSKTGREGAGSCDWRITGGGELTFYAGANNYGILTLPALQNGINNVKISFKARWGLQPTELFIGTIADVNNGLSFSPFDTLPSRFITSDDEYANFITYIENYAGSNNHIAFRHNDLTNAYAGFLFLDDILIEDVSDCPEPYNLRTLATTNNNALIAWKQAKLDGPWEISYGAPGFNPETEGVLISDIQDQSFNIGGLNPGSNYELYIRSICQSHHSDWSTPMVFSTIPDPIQIPYFENFENSILPNLPPGYKNIGELWFGAKTSWELGLSNSNSLYLIHGQNESKSIIILPYLDSDIRELMMYFTYLNLFHGYHLDVGVIRDINDPASFLSHENISLDLARHQEVSIDFTDYEGQDGNIAIRIEAGSFFQSGGYIWLDEIIVFSPSNLPSIIFKEISSSTLHSAYASGRVMHQGSQAVSSRGFVWNNEPNPTIENNNGYINMGSGEGVFESHLYNLNPGNTYYIRAFASNSEGTVYTEQEIFQAGQQAFNTITAASGSGGNISPEGIVNVNYGQNQTFTIEPSPGYEIANVLVNGEGVGAVSAYTFSNVTTNHTIESRFRLTTVIHETERLACRVFPNPAKNFLILESNLIIKEIHLVDLSGRILHRESVLNIHCEVDISMLQSGLYIIRLYADQDIATRRFQVIK